MYNHQNSLKIKFLKIVKCEINFLSKFKKFFINRFKPNTGFLGVYESFEIALSNSKGYSDEIIFEKLKKTAFKFLKGYYAFERDTVLFKRKQYNHPIVQSLILSKKNDKEINICDYGGSLGSLYFQNNSAIKMKIKWSVIDFENVVLFGKNI
jgi:putative methyltransferase (TIGR04325 family)